MAVVLAAAAAVLLVVAAAVGPDNSSMSLRVVYLLAAGAGLLLMIVAAGWAGRRRLDQWLSERMLDMASPAIVRSMAPRNVLGALLPWIYGDVNDHQEVLTGILGGPGRDLAGRDTAVSRNTTAHFRFRPVSHATWNSELTWTHDFTGVRKNHKFVVFATHDGTVAEAVIKERTFPLFELWNFADEDQLDHFVNRSPKTFDIGITYTDVSGTLYRVAPRKVTGSEVPLKEFDEFVRLSPTIERHDLYIVAFDLWDLAHPDHVVETIQSLTVTVHGQVDVDAGYFTWSPPHPCFVREVTFDVAEFPDGSPAYEFRLVPSMMRNTAVVLSGWQDREQQMHVALDSWMLPGHGVTLLWRATA